MYQRPQGNPYGKMSSNTYQNNSVNTASPAKLIEMLYQNSVERLDKTMLLIKDKNFIEANKQIIRVQEIITELNISLNMEVGGEVSTNLRALYDFIYRRLVEANVKKDIKIVKECRDMINELLVTWKEAMKKAGDTIKEMTSKAGRSFLDIET